VSERPQYNALNGQELAEIILKDLRQELSIWLHPHICYNNFMWMLRGTIHISEHDKPETTIPITLGTTEPILVPDRERARVGLPLPRAEIVKNAGIVDIKMVEGL
jgi:hypothetical protein